MSKLLWNAENGLHYAEPEELREVAQSMFRKADDHKKFREGSIRKRLARKGKKMMRAARWSERDA